jgi:hypothetical protein
MWLLERRTLLILVRHMWLLEWHMLWLEHSQW